MVWFDKILRSLFGTIDGILGWAASTLYTLIVQIANVDIFGNYIYTMMGRIYTFLAIFMLFKLSISVVNYVLNPDQLTDKSKGFGKLIQNVIIVMALIIMTPQIFNWAYKLQAAILNTNVLYTIVTGKPNDSSYDYSDLQGLTSKEIVEKLTKNAEDSGDMIKYELLSTFIYNEYSEDEHTAVKSDGTLCNKETTGSYSVAYDCLMDGDTINNTSGSSSDKHYGAKKGFRNEYKILVSTLCIGFAAYVFLVTAFDVALRCVKLGALQLMAPVPIISMLDPNSGKSGMFSKWLKECKNTYLSLFTRLISVYFAVEVIRGLTEPGRFVWYGTDVAVGFGFVKVFVILGLLMFAKQLPKFIEDATGIKMDTGGLNLKKKLDSVPGSKAVGTLGKKGIAGIDAMMNGRRFREGWNKIEGTGPLAKFNKWKNDMTPFTAEKNKLRAQGKNEVYEMNKKWTDGVDVAKKMMNAGAGLAGTANGWDKVLDGSVANKKYYEAIYKNKDFVNAIMARDKADDKNKKLNDLYNDIQLKGASAVLGTAGVTIDGKTYTVSNTNDLVADRRKQEAILKGATDNFESIKKQHAEDARTEQQYKTIKNNELNPTNNARSHRSVGIK